jgi:hypothetical protein
LPILGRLSTKRHRKALQALAAGHEHSDVLARTIVRQACKYKKIKGPFPPPARATLSPTLRHWKPPPSCSAVRAPQAQGRRRRPRAGNGVEPTNNRAERALRFGVQWRKRSVGTASEKGNRWVERILSLKETCRLRSVSTYHVLVEAVARFFTGQQPQLAWLQ